jgi:hypothetical protein
MMRHEAGTGARVDEIPPAVVVAARARRKTGSATTATHRRWSCARALRAARREPTCGGNAVRIEKNERIATAAGHTAIACSGGVAGLAGWTHGDDLCAGGTRDCSRVVRRAVIDERFQRIDGSDLPWMLPMTSAIKRASRGAGMTIETSGQRWTPVSPSGRSFVDARGGCDMPTAYPVDRASAGCA